MRFMMIVKADKNSESGVFRKEDKKMFADMGKFNEEMVKAGVMLAGEGLLPSSKGSRITYTTGQPTVTDGPFTETKELVAGFWLIQVASKEEALEWARRAPFGPGAVLEIRQVAEVTDFPPDVFPPEEAAREQELRDQLQRKTSRP